MVCEPRWAVLFRSSVHAGVGPGKTSVIYTITGTLRFKRSRDREEEKCDRA